MSVSSQRRRVAPAKPRVIAYQTGILYPRFGVVNRVELAGVFDAHGFSGAARRIREVDAHRSLSSVCSRVSGNSRTRGLRVSAIGTPRRGELVAFQVDALVRVGGAVESIPGARLFADERGVHTTSPEGRELLPACLAFAEELRQTAEDLIRHADTGAVSRALTSMIEEARAYRFIAKGSYVLRADDPVAERVIACLREIRLRFYDPVTRSGLRAAVVEVVDTPDNLAALSDAIIDDVERQTGALATLLEEDPNRKLHEATIGRRLGDAERLLGGIAAARPLIGGAADSLERVARGLVAAYQHASPARRPVFPDWLRQATARLTPDEDGGAAGVSA